MAVFCEFNNKPSLCLKCVEFLLLAEKQVTLQEGP